MTLAAENTAENVAEKVGEKAMEKPLEKRKALGRGLESLLPGPRAIAGNASILGGLRTGEDARASTDNRASNDGEPGTVAEIQAAAARRGASVLQLKLDQIEPNPYQTRSRVDGEYLAQLAASIEANGVLQPVTVRPGKEEGKYVLIAGECRWKASALAKQETIPAIVKVVSDQQAMELTIIENLQRADLSCMDQAHAFERLSREFQLTQVEISLRTGVERSTVANYMRMLKLPHPVLQLLSDGQLVFGQAKILMSLYNPEVIVRVAERAARFDTSVRDLETIVFNLNVPVQGGRKVGDKRYVDPNVRLAQRTLEEALGVRVKIKDKSGRGSILIEYKSLEDFDRVVEVLGRK
jgi:ParB family chromosome partitioning protein